MTTPLALALCALAGWKATTANVELPVPRGWRFNPNEHQPSPSVPGANGACSTSIWFDVIPGATLDYARKLISTESLEVTAAIRHWMVPEYRETVLAAHSASAFRLETRNVYLVPFEHGVLIAQTMADGERPKLCLPMADGAAARLVELFFARDVQVHVSRLVAEAKPPPLNTLDPIPATLVEALEMLVGKIPPDQLDQIRASSDEESMFGLHHGLGRALRNQWGLWSDSPLARFFGAIGVHHPDDMSSIILISFWRKLHGRPLEVDRQAAAARRYCESNRSR